MAASVQSNPSMRVVALAFGAVVIAFTAATALSTWRSNAVETSALEISGQLSPGIRRLAEGRAELRQLLALLTSGNRRDAGLVWIHADQLHRDYLEQIDDPNESQQQLRELLPRLEVRINAILEATTPDPTAQRETVATVEKMLGIDLRCLDQDAASAQRLAARIRRVHGSARHLGFVLDGLASILSIIAAALLWRSAQHHAALIDANTRLLEERATELEHFAVRVAHDIAGAMNSAGISLQHAERTAFDDRSRRMFVLGHAGLRRATEIVRGMLDFARSGARPPPGSHADVAVVLNQVIEQSLNDAEAARVRLRALELPNARVACDPGILASVVGNLVRNAVKYTAGVGAAQVIVRAQIVATFVRVEVEDNGPGIPCGQEEAIFEPYVRGENVTAPGLGIGLSTVKRFVVAHRGRVGVRVAEPRGCIFWIELPLADSAPATREESPPPSGNE